MEARVDQDLATMIGEIIEGKGHRLYGLSAINQRAHASQDSYITPDKYPAIHEAMLNACDASEPCSSFSRLSPKFQ